MSGQIVTFADQTVVLAAPAPGTAGAAIAIAALLIGAAAGLRLGRRQGRADCAALEARLAERTATLDAIQQRIDRIMAPAPAVPPAQRDPSSTATLQQQTMPTDAFAPRPFAAPARELADERPAHRSYAARTRSGSGGPATSLAHAPQLPEPEVEQRLAAMTTQLSDAYRRFSLALDASPITVFEQDTDLRMTFMYNPPPGTTVDDFTGRTDEELGIATDLLIPAKKRVLATRTGESLELEVTVSGIPRFYYLRLEPRLAEDGSAIGVIGTALDLTERRRSEDRMRGVMRELTHRSKNLLAVIQSMARKTASLAPDVETFVVDFSARLRAMSASHDLLVEEAWSGAEISALLVANLAPSVDPRGPRVTMDGPRLKLDPDAAQTLGLAFHELTVNAVRHGALSVPHGHVAVTWEQRDGHVDLHWRERGGPLVDAPDRRGFGRLLLERLTGASLGGEVRLDFAPGGVDCTIRFPVDRLTDK